MALENTHAEGPHKHDIELYTDCESIIKLAGRRQKLEASNYISASKGILLANADLYQKFFNVCDLTSPRLTWVKGHCKKSDQTYIHRNFSYLDKAVRQQLRSQCLSSEGI